MADISSQLSKIQSSERGEDVRNAINSALQAINNDVPPDIANPIQIVEDMPTGSDLTISYDPPVLVNQIHIKQAGSGGRNTYLKTLKVERNNTVWPRDDDDYDPDKDIVYYNKVTVDVPTIANKVTDLEDPITHNGEYTAYELDGADGIRSFTVSVNEAAGDGPFQVDFYDKIKTDPTAEVIQTVIVPKDGAASFDSRNGYPTSPIGQSFVGWNPDPSCVTRDMKCYPKFADQSVAVGEISEDWDVICSKHGAGYDIGAYKSLAYGAEFTQDEMRAVFGSSINCHHATYETRMLMFKVAEGEDGSTSSWLGVADTNTIVLRDSGGSQIGLQPLWPPRDQANGWPQQGDMYCRGFYNGPYFNHMAECFRQNIKQVTKYSVIQNVVYPTGDKIWLPSVKEIFLDGVKANDPSGDADYYYDGGILSNGSWRRYTEEEYAAAKEACNYLRLNTSPVTYAHNLEIRTKTRCSFDGSGNINLYVRDCDGGAGGPAARTDTQGFDIPRRDPFSHPTFIGFCL